MATAIIPHQPQGWINKVEALRLSKLIVKEQIKARGERLKDYEMKEITALAEQWLSQHRAELLGQAAVTMALIAERKSKHMHRDRAWAKPGCTAISTQSGWGGKSVR